MVPLPGRNTRWRRNAREFFCELAGDALARDARNVGAHDAEIGKLTVSEQIELTPGGVVTVPALEAV